MSGTPPPAEVVTTSLLSSNSQILREHSLMAETTESIEIAKIKEENLEIAIIAMGSFWKADAIFGGVHEVVATDVGFVNGIECVRIKYDAHLGGFDKLIDVFEES